ncbi:hypothetical protein FIBSPDRAFT_989509 [Athelia psychrophila]|uniref:DUF4238 domain-containing protein n=1 Tax=Athelia psychrophila TaxID=1759441 RepID=A0A165ZL56_9AGAM|nr:hypothetical protein FIBSPDRAFT_989509 [Fibularhizoctonia sp. CBS 109695]
MTSKPTASKALPLKDQYQHYIPRFILRRYQVGPVKSKAERNKEYRRTRIIPEYVLYYDIQTATLDTRPIGEVYGVYGLYKDATNAEDVNELEKKLSVLEADAAKILLDLHSIPGRTEYAIKRTELECLRKFLFLMHYRKDALAQSYFQADHPENKPIRAWIEHFQAKHKLATATDAWLHGLRYYLFTPHSQIMQHAVEGTKNGELLIKMASGADIPHDIDATHYHSLAYQAQGDAFSCIWEASDGEEFILTDNGFGLWEGLLNGVPDAHRIFVVSPRFAIVLRSSFMRPDVPHVLRPQITSNLATIQQGPPAVAYSTGLSVIRSDQDLETYRASEQAKSDLFTFQINKLTPSQTHSINAVLLKNARSDGAVTFLSKACMLNTARTFCASFLNLPDRSKYQPLIHILNEVDIELFTLLMKICTGQDDHKSKHNRVLAVFRLLHREEPVICEFYLRYIQLSKAAIARYITRAGALADASDDRHGGPVSRMQLIPSIPGDGSDDTLAGTVDLLRSLGIPDPNENPLDILEHEVAAMSLLNWAIQEPARLAAFRERVALLKVKAPSQPLLRDPM